MSGNIYILSDGNNTKIGITVSLDKRLSSFSTHNPNFYIYKTYECPIHEAKKIEAVIKLFFKESITGTGKEWFAVQPEEINRIVAFLLEKSADFNLTPAMHGIPLTNEAYEVKELILKALAKHEGVNSPDSHKQKNKMAELFASSFKLGIPEHRLPQDIVIKDNLCLDFYNANLNSSTAKNAQNENYAILPYDNNKYNFYHLIKLASGSYIAICTSRVSMPFLETIKDKNAEILEAANNLGLLAYNFNDWSWHTPDETGLILYSHKTPAQKRINLWDNSFRKWVIERSKLLEQDQFGTQEEQNTYNKTIEYICYDTSFPLHVQSAKELYDCYLETFLGSGWNDEEPHFMLNYYKFLFDKWKNN